MQKIIKITGKNALILAAVALVCAAVSAVIYYQTEKQIQAQIQAHKQQLLGQVLPQNWYDNDLLATCHAPQAPFNQDPNLKEICVAKKNGKITAYAFETVAPNGYAGPIHMIAAITPQGEMLGMRVTEQHETPGLGDKVEMKNTSWAESFTHKFLRKDNLNQWAVKKDGGMFDQFTGATITPRAVVNQVKDSSWKLLQHLPQQNVTENGQ